jgi:Ca-activated chloride channel family protein
MRFPAFILIIFAFVCLLGGAQQPQSANPPEPAQQQPSPGNGDQSPTSKIVTQVDVVNVVFTVQDDNGRFVRDLSRAQFRILDNNLPPREITSFEAQTGLPLRVGMLIDASNSIRDRFKFEQQAATEFLQQTLSPNSDQAMVESFDEVYEVVQDFTGDLDKLSASLRKISPGGSTAMWDAVYYACREKLMKQQNSGQVRNVIVLISDGNDTQSHVYRQEAIDMAQRAEATIYTVSTNLGFSRSEGDHNLRVLAEATGGQAFFPAALDDVADAFVHIQHELRSQYSISYKPDNFQPNGQYRTISIKALHGGFKVRAKKGYYARKQ